MADVRGRRLKLTLPELSLREYFVDLVRQVHIALRDGAGIMGAARHGHLIPAVHEDIRVMPDRLRDHAHLNNEAERMREVAQFIRPGDAVTVAFPTGEFRKSRADFL